jgi:hypothetical protein
MAAADGAVGENDALLKAKVAPPIIANSTSSDCAPGVLTRQLTEQEVRWLCSHRIDTIDSKNVRDLALTMGNCTR